MHLTTRSQDARVIFLEQRGNLIDKKNVSEKVVILVLFYVHCEIIALVVWTGSEI